MTTTIYTEAPAREKVLLVLAHGAGAPCDHPHMTAIAGALAAAGIDTLRFNFPFMDESRRRVDKTGVCLDTFAAVLAEAKSAGSGARIYLGGHSFGGRMSTHFAAERNVDGVDGLVLFSFPLHVAKKPGTKRADHLPMIKLPMLFLSGTRDALADPVLLQGVTDPLPQAKLHWLETADHSFKILKRTRTDPENVYAEAARVTKDWITSTN